MFADDRCIAKEMPAHPKYQISSVAYVVYQCNSTRCREVTDGELIQYGRSLVASPSARLQTPPPPPRVRNELAGGAAQPSGRILVPNFGLAPPPVVAPFDRIARRGGASSGRTRNAIGE